MQESYHNEPSTMMNCAMNMGAVAGVYYIAKFCLFPLSLRSTMVALLFWGLTLVVPFLIYQLTKCYRDRFCNGQIEFTRAFFFSMLTMCFGSLLVAVAHYVYFAFIDGGAVVSILLQGIEQWQSMDLSALEETDATAVTQFNQYIDAVKQTVLQLQSLSPIDIAMGMLSNNFSWSIILSLPIALVVRKIK